MTDKAQLRAALRARRAAFVVQLDAATAARLRAQLADVVMPQLTGAGSVAVYAAHGTEIDPADIAARLQQLGRRLLWPRVNNATDTLSFHACAPQALVPGFRGLSEPPADAPAAIPGVILLPLVGADLAGNRIGQGGGHYDRTLAALRASGHHPQTVGLAWEVQVVDAIAPDAWDQRLDALATPARWMRFSRQ
ncbi:5-formyltetrahydrofolate cyclo-ligase [Polymorphobacter arshaanensis]|uniref:5-formyltetrahydrofolate cyclo-ligase n=1 Tax=Glacieibacterium arshaanense TaxID=2511025 RepID=A0A4Y9ETN3_9SPHN|nr:5-formyltetrahydrofolate cyclo-ligase [Polymorphobacter arshaanensis]